MMGIIMQQLKNFIETQGKDKLDKILERSGFKDIEIKPEEIYPESDFQKLVSATVEVLGIDANTAQIEFAKYVFPVLKEEFPGYFQTAKDTKTFLKRVPRIHLDLPGIVGSSAGTVEKLKVIKDDPFTIYYRSPNKLCILMKKLIELSAENYGQKAEIEEPKCMIRGDDHCEVVVKFA